MLSPKFWLIAAHEYQYNFRRPMYLFTAFGLPLLMIVVMYVVVVVIIKDAKDLSGFDHVGYVDLSSEGVLANLDDDRPSRFIAFENEDAARAALDEGAVGAYLVVGGDYMSTGQVALYSTKSIPENLKSEINTLLSQGVANLAPAGTPIERLIDPLNVQKIRSLSDGSEFSDPEELMPRFILPIIFSMVMFMGINITSQLLMGGVVEEKENRMMEVLVTSCTPSDLLWGKVIGLGGIALTQIVTWLLSGYVLASFQADVGGFMSNANITIGQIAFFLLVFLLNYFLFAAISIGIGASVTAEQEARQFASIFSLIGILPMMFLAAYITNQKLVVIGLSLFPLTAPMSLIIGLSFDILPTWLILLSIGMLTVSVVLAIFVSVYVFRLGMLMYGQRLGLRQLWQRK